MTARLQRAVVPTSIISSLSAKSFTTATSSSVKHFDSSSSFFNVLSIGALASKNRDRILSNEFHLVFISKSIESVFTVLLLAVIFQWTLREQLDNCSDF